MKSIRKKGGRNGHRMHNILNVTGYKKYFHKHFSLYAKYSQCYIIYSTLAVQELFQAFRATVRGRETIIVVENLLLAAFTFKY